MHCRQKVLNKHIKCCTRRERPQFINLPQLDAADDGGHNREHERVPASPPNRVYGSERGQHRFLLEFPHPSADAGDTDTPPAVLMEREPLIFEDYNT